VIGRRKRLRRDFLDLWLGFLFVGARGGGIVFAPQLGQGRERD